MKITKKSRLERCIDMMHMLKYNSERGIKVSRNAISKDFGLSVAVINSAIETGMLSKNRGIYIFNKEISVENIKAVLQTTIQYYKEKEAENKSRKSVKEVQHPELFNPTPETVKQKATPEMMLQVVKHFREHPDMIDSMLRLLQEQLEDQFNLQ